MPLDTTRANGKTDAITESFALIGHDNGSLMPRSKDNREPMAWELHVAKLLKRLAEAREKRAVTAAVKAGVMFDHEKAPKPVGTHEIVFTGEVVEVAVDVTTAATKLDIAGLIVDLERAGLTGKAIKRMVDKNTSENRAPHKFTTSLITRRA